MTEVNANTPPEELTRFVPDSSVYGNVVTWQIKSSGQFGECMTLCQKPLINFQSIVVGLCFAAVSMGGSLAAKHFAGKIPKEFSEFFHHGLFWLGCFFVVAFPAFWAFAIFLDSFRWKDNIRLQFDRSSKVLQLPNDKVEYRPGDYKRLILGYTTGYLFHTYRDRTSTEHTTISGAQFYLLILDQNSIWKRHDLGIAMNRRHARKTIEKLQTFLRCESFERKMKRPECKKLNIPEE